MSLPTVLWLSAVVVLILGRFHFLFRDVSDRGDFPTTTSFWLRIGSVLVANALLLAALILFVVRR